MKISTLKEIRNLIKKHKDIDMGLLRVIKNDGKTSFTENFIEFLDDPELLTDDAFSMKLYGKTGLDEYRSLKKRVSRMLLNQLFHLNISENDKAEPKQILLYETSRNMHAVKTLLMMGERSAAIELAEDALTTSIARQHFDGAVYFASEIRYHCAITGENKGFEKYNNILIDNLQKQQATFMAEQHALAFHMVFVRKRHRKPHLSEMAHQHADEIMHLFNKHQTFDIGRTYFRLRNQAFQNEANYNESNKVLNEWLGFLENNKTLAWNSLFAEIFLNKIENVIHINDYKEGHKNIELCSKYLPEVNYNWFVLKDLEFLLLMHEGNYSSAHQLVVNVLAMDAFKKITEVRQEKWKIYHVYATFAMNFIAGDKSIKTESIKKLDNELAFYNSDKKGMYVNVLILHALKSLVTDDDFFLEENQKSLEQYYIRHLKDAANSRSKVFLQALISVTRANDENREKVIKSVEKQCKKLNELSIDLDNKEMQEVIPFEVLCEWMLRKVKKW